MYFCIPFATSAFDITTPKKIGTSDQTSTINRLAVGKYCFP
jgi:hypothetical protein